MTNYNRNLIIIITHYVRSCHIIQGSRRSMQINFIFYEFNGSIGRFYFHEKLNEKFSRYLWKLLQTRSVPFVFTTHMRTRSNLFMEGKIWF